MRPISTTTLLLLADQVAAFFPNGRAGSLNQRMPTRISTSEALNAPTSINNYSNYPPRVRLRGIRGFSLSSGNGNGTPSWRYEVDDLIKAASPWGSLVETEIIATDLLKRLPEVAADVSDATRRGTLLSEVVLGKGTEARLTVDGLKAVNRQLREDILPKALKSAPRIVKGPSGSRTGAKGSDKGRVGTGVNSSASRKVGDGRTGPMEGVAETLYSIRNAVKGLTPRKIREGLQSVASETENVFSRTPSGLFSPEYSVEDKREGFEVRRYAPYAVCSAPMAGEDVEDEGELNGDIGTLAGSGEGFNTLAGYLFGNNTQERAMDMTTPVNIDVNPVGGRTMSFVMPKDISAKEAPVPRDSRILVNDVAAGEILAVREFPGFATDGEVKRQLDSLLGALEREATRPWSEFSGGSKTSPMEEGKAETASPWRAEDPSGMAYRLMQYNPPYTLPWLRTNAIAVKVYKEGLGAAVEEAHPEESVPESSEKTEEVSSAAS